MSQIKLPDEPILDVAHLGPLELLTPTPERSLAFFVDVLGMTESGRAGESVYLRGWDDYERYSLKLTGSKSSGLGHAAFRARSPQALARRVQALMDAGAGFGIKPFGIRAMDSLRLEKSYKLVGRELSIEYAALESELARFIDFNKDFLGKEALLKWRDKGFANKLVTLELSGVKDFDARGSEPVLKDGVAVGRTTSGGYGWRTGKSLAIAMVKPELAKEGTELTVRVLGEDFAARVIGDSPFDPENAALRG